MSGLAYDFSYPALKPHNPRLAPKWLAESILHQALSQVPRSGHVQVTIDWTTEGGQHLLVISLLIGRRGVPIYWRAYDPSMLKGRMHRYERAVIKRAFKLIFQYVRRGRIRLAADRGFADGDLFDLLRRLKIGFIIRVKGGVKVCLRGQWLKLSRLRFTTCSRHRDLGRVPYCQRSPRQLWVTMSRARDRHGQWGVWYLVSNWALGAQ